MIMNRIFFLIEHQKHAVIIYLMKQEFCESAGWYLIMEFLCDELFPPAFLELLEDYRCRFSRRDLRRACSAKSVKALIASLAELGEDSHTEDVAKWLLHTDTTSAVVILEAIEAVRHRADSLEGVEPVPPNAFFAVKFCLSHLRESLWPLPRNSP